jgi:hypothetical protein
VPTFRGNVGKLLQHWVLCEVLSACQNHYQRLGFIDAYSMAPFADERPKLDATAPLFDEVCRRLPGRQSLYERAWLKLAPNTHEYPNSASFVTAAWRGRYAMLLCEKDPATIQELDRCGLNCAPVSWLRRYRNRVGRLADAPAGPAAEVS